MTAILENCKTGGKDVAMFTTELQISVNSMRLGNQLFNGTQRCTSCAAGRFFLFLYWIFMAIKHRSVHVYVVPCGDITAFVIALFPNSPNGSLVPEQFENWIPHRILVRHLALADVLIFT